MLAGWLSAEGKPHAAAAPAHCCGSSGLEEQGLRSTKGSHLPCHKDVAPRTGRYPRTLRGAAENKQQITAFMLPAACPDSRWDITHRNEDLVLWEYWLLWVSPLEQPVRALLWSVTARCLISRWECTQTENSYFSCIFQSFSGQLFSATVIIVCHLRASLNLWVWV